MAQTKGRLVVYSCKQYQIFLAIADGEMDESTTEKFHFKMFIPFKIYKGKNPTRDATSTAFMRSVENLELWHRVAS